MQRVVIRTAAQVVVLLKLRRHYDKQLSLKLFEIKPHVRYHEGQQGKPRAAPPTYSSITNQSTTYK